MTAKLHPLLLAQESLGEADLPRVGAKNAGLGFLAGLGLATPRGYALTTEAFRLHLGAAGAVWVYDTPEYKEIGKYSLDKQDSLWRSYYMRQRESRGLKAVL